MVGIKGWSREATEPKKAYHHGDLRNAIITEATARARADGEKAIILREIAPQLGVSATAAYRHFTNRQQLVEEVSAKGFEAMVDWVAAESVPGAEAAPGLAAYVELRNAATAVVDFTAAETAWARMMIETLGASEVVAAAADRVRVLLQEIIDRGIAAGVFRPGTEVGTARVFWAGIDGLCSQVMFRVLPQDDDAAQSATARTLDLCMTDLLTDEGARVREAVTLPDGIVTELPD